MPTTDRSFRPDNYWDVPAYHDRTGTSHPSWLGDAYLPDLLPGEVEIARLEALAGTRDVVSVRARRRGRDGRIFYRVVDEYGTVLRWRPRSSRRPLSLGRLIALVDSIECGVAGEWEGWIEQVMRRSATASLDERATAAAVASTYYPALREHYRTATRAVARARCSAGAT